MFQQTNQVRRLETVLLLVVEPHPPLQSECSPSPLCEEVYQLETGSANGRGGVALALHRHAFGNINLCA